MLKFTDPKVAEKYDTIFKHGPIVHVPGGDVLEGGWKGKLSTIPLWAAKKAVAMKSNILFAKVDPAKEKAEDEEKEHGQQEIIDK